MRKASAPADVALALINIKQTLTDLSFECSGLMNDEQLRKVAEMSTILRDEAATIRRWAYGEMANTEPSA